METKELYHYLREAQAQMKVVYVENLRRFDFSGDPSDQRKMEQSRDSVHAIERRLPGNNGNISSVVGGYGDLVRSKEQEQF